MNNKTVIAVVAVSALTILLCVFLVMSQSSDDGLPEGDDYLYVMYTDPLSNVNVVDVYESHMDGRSATPLEQRYRTSVGPDGINSKWVFDKNGLGPFNSFYAAINLTKESSVYENDDSAERRLSDSVGEVAYILNPDDLGSTLSGHRFDKELYNVMLVIPTVYWSSDRITQSETVGNLEAGKQYNILYMSSCPSYSLSGGKEIAGMKAYAHSASYNAGEADFSTNVYPYLCIGVYESYITDSNDVVGSGLLVSQSGRAVSHNKTVDEFKGYADALTPAGTKKLESDYQLWNYYQWTLCKIMSYTVMGSKNSQVMVGLGYSYDNESPAVSGSTDTVGFFGNAKATESESGIITTEAGRVSSKLFIENGWGSLNEFLGDSFVEGYEEDFQRLHAGNRLGGETMIESRNQPYTGGIWANVSEYKGISSTETKPSIWDMPYSTEKSAHPDDPTYPGDAMNGGDSGVYSIVVGGNWDHRHNNGAAFACAGYPIDYTADYRGARLAYLLGDLTTTSN